MKPSISNFAVVFLALFLSYSTQLFAEGKGTEEKEITKTYSVSGADKVRIENKHGNIKVYPWDKNEVYFKATIRVEGKKPEEILERITVNHGKDGSEVFIITEIENKRGSYKVGQNFRIDYELKIPKKNKLELTNKFGAVFIGSFDGALDCTVKHGSLTVETLTSNDVRIESKFGNIDIDNLADATLESAHGNLSVSKGGNLQIESSHGSVSLGDCQEVILETAHGKVDIDKAEKVRTELAHGRFQVGTLTKELKLEIQHGSVKIEKVASSAERVIVEASHGSVRMGFDSSPSIDFEVDTSFGRLRNNHESNTNYKTTREENTSAYYKGTIGGGKTEVRLETRHGSVHFE